MLWVLICTLNLTVCSSYHVMYAFQSESTLYSCVNVKELLARNTSQLIYRLSGCGFESRCSHLNIRYRACFEQGVFDIQSAMECGFTLKCVPDMIKKTYRQMHCTNKYSQHSPIIWPVWLNGWVFVYELSGCGFVSPCSRLSFRYHACFEKGVSWHSGNYSE